MSNNGSRQVRERVELLKLARAHDGQHAFHGALTLRAACAEHDFPPLNGRAQGPLGGRMPRAGLCRVGLNRAQWFTADLLFAFAGVSA
jgi:hypothetical protein